RQDDLLCPAPALPLRRRVRLPVPVRLAPVLVPAPDLHGGDLLRGPRPASGQLPHDLRRLGSPWRDLRAGSDPRDRPQRDSHRPGRRRRHSDYRRPRRAQDPRGARRPPGARRRPRQEPCRAQVPGPHARDGPVQRLRDPVRPVRRCARRARQRSALGPLLGHPVRQRLHHRPVGLGPEDHHLRGDHRDRVLLQGHDRLRRRRGRRPRRQPGGRRHVPGDLLLRLRLHPALARDAPEHPGHQVMNELLVTPRELLASTGEFGRFAGNMIRDVWGLRVFRFFGEALRQSGILIVSSTLIIWALMFVLGLECGIEGAYFLEAQGAPAYAGVFTAWCDLREIIPYAFGYMMAAKVGTGIVAELGAMRISDEIDALEVMGINSMTFLCATRLLAAWVVLPFMYLAGVGAAFLASYIAVVQQVATVSAGGYFLIFWQFQNPPDFLYSLIKAMFMATAIVLVGCYYGYNASGGPVGVGTATAKSMVLNIILVHL